MLGIQQCELSISELETQVVFNVQIVIASNLEITLE